MDIDNDTLPDKVLKRKGVRFIFLCSDGHRRLLLRETEANAWWAAEFVPHTPFARSFRLICAVLPCLSPPSLPPSSFHLISTRYSCAENFSLLNKPVKRLPLWSALLSRGQMEETPAAVSTMERTHGQFSFRCVVCGMWIFLVMRGVAAKTHFTCCDSAARQCWRPAITAPSEWSRRSSKPRRLAFSLPKTISSTCRFVTS